MVLTKLLKAHGTNDYEYVNLEQICFITVHVDNDFHVEMADQTSLHIAITDPTIVALVVAADGI